MPNPSSVVSEPSAGVRVLAVRGAIGGLLMGLANLVPGIAGGAMLLAAGVYTEFIKAIAELTSFRFRLRSIVLIASIGSMAGLAILSFAGVVQHLVIDYRWIMYSLFIGLTLGGMPLLLRMAKPIDKQVIVGAVGGLLIMIVLAFGAGQVGRGGDAGMGLLFFAGLIGGTATMLQGIGGGYFLLLLGVYEPILGAIDRFKVGLVGNPLEGTGPNLDLAVGALSVLVPVGIGVGLGIAGISHLLQWLLERYHKPTLGVLVGLVAGSVIGLWPFQLGVEPQAGMELGGKILTAETAAAIDPEKWPVVFFSPTIVQVLVAVVLVVVGYVICLLVDALGLKLQAAQAARG